MPTYRSRRLTSLLLAIPGLALAGCSDPVAVPPVRMSPLASVAAAVPSVFPIGNVLGYGVNDAGTIVGPSDGNKSSAYLWDSSTGLVLIRTGGLAWDVSQDGLAVGGKSAAGKPVLWTATQLGDQRTEVVLPDAEFGGAVRAMVSDASGHPVLMTGNVFRNGSTKTPARWTPCLQGPPCPTGWQLSTITVTAPIVEAWGQDINPSGMVVGMEGTGCCRAAFWDANDNQTVLLPLNGGAAAAWGINDAGTLITGQSDGVAVMWLRASTGDSFTTPMRLDTTTCRGGGTSIAYAVNPDFSAANDGTTGTIVGQACGNPVAWKVSITSLLPTITATITRIALPSTGRSTAGQAQSINRSNGGHYRIAGQVNGTGVYWTNF